MVQILILDNQSETLDKLIQSLQNLGVNPDVKTITETFQPEKYSGFIISGGFLPRDRYKEVLNTYKKLLYNIQQPLLGICLGLRIMGFCYDVRIRKMEKEENGVVKIFFYEEYPLAPKRRKLKVYETHLYELISLGEDLVNYGSSAFCKIQAVKHKNKPQFGVQFHPEINGGNEGQIILRNFVELCGKERKK